MSKYFLIIISCFICTACCAQDDTTLLANWKNYPVPGTIEPLVAGKPCPTEWTVFFRNDTIRVIATKNYKPSELPFKITLQDDLFSSNGNISFLKVDDGYLVGFNNGEFGGNLFWFSPNGKKHYNIMSGGQIVQIIERNSKIYAIQGFQSFGSIINIQKENNVWVAKQHLDLPDGPEIVALDSQQDFIIIASTSMLKVNKTMNICKLIDTAIWSHRANANSIIIKNNIVYVGLFGGVFQYDLNTDKQYWLLNK